MNKMMRNLLAAALVVGMSSLAAQETTPAAAETVKAETAATAAAPAAAAKAEPAKPEALPEPTTGTVITDEGWVERCILAMVVTAVDGVAITDADPVEKIEFEPGEHTVSGYANDEDRSPCATFSGDNAVVVPEGTRIGESTVTVNVVAGKEYFLGVDVRSTDQKNWKIVTWKINH
jgi:hypothetical protein